MWGALGAESGGLHAIMCHVGISEKALWKNASLKRVKSENGCVDSLAKRLKIVGENYVQYSSVSCIHFLRG